MGLPEFRSGSPESYPSGNAAKKEARIHRRTTQRVLTTCSTARDVNLAALAAAAGSLLMCGRSGAEALNLGPRRPLAGWPSRQWRGASPRDSRGGPHQEDGRLERASHFHLPLDRKHDGYLRRRRHRGLCAQPPQVRSTANCMAYQRARDGIDPSGCSALGPPSASGPRDAQPAEDPSIKFVFHFLRDNHGYATDFQVLPRIYHIEQLVPNEQ